MATSSAHRAVTVHRVARGRFAVENDRGGQITFGTGGMLDVVLGPEAPTTGRRAASEATTRVSPPFC